MSRRRLAGALAAALAIGTPALAAEKAVPSCYAAFPIGLPPPLPAREVFVLVDQSTPLDPGIAATLRQNVARLVRPGSDFTIASFSAFERSHYVTVLTSGALEAPVALQRRAAISVRQLGKLDGCLGQQAAFGQRLALKTIAQAQGGSAGSFAHSEIMASLRQLAPRVAASHALDRIVIVVSDMLEHSSTTSFYRGRAVRAIDTRPEMGNAVANGLIGDFRGARVFVVGGGLLAGGSEAGRDARAINALETFWSAYFRRSNARLVAFGRPDLVQPIE